MSRLITKDNRLVTKDNRGGLLAPGQTPEQCECCGGGSAPLGLCCDLNFPPFPYPNAKRYLVCGLRLSPENPTATAFYNANAVSSFSDVYNGYENRTAQISTSGEELIAPVGSNHWCAYGSNFFAVKDVPGEYKIQVLIQWESLNVWDNLPKAYGINACEGTFGVEFKRLAFLSFACQTVFDYGPLGLRTVFFEEIQYLDDFGGHHVASYIEDHESGCSLTHTGDLGDGCQKINTLGFAGVLDSPTQRRVFDMQITLTLPWKEECPPPGGGKTLGTSLPASAPPPESGCADCGKHRRISTL